LEAAIDSFPSSSSSSYYYSYIQWSMMMMIGVFIREFYVVGGDMLVGAGLLICTATVFTNDQLFLNGE